MSLPARQQKLNFCPNCGDAVPHNHAHVNDEVYAWCSGCNHLAIGQAWRGPKVAPQRHAVDD